MPLNEIYYIIKKKAWQAEQNGKEEDSAGELAAFLGRFLYNFQAMKDRLFVLRAAMAANYEELVIMIKGMFTPQELEIVEQSLKN